MAQTAALPVLSGETGLTRYLEEIGGSPCWSRRRNTCWPRAGANTATATPRISSSPAICGSWPDIAMGYRGYGLPISEVISEGDVGLMQAVKRFEPEKGFRLATYAMWWIKAAMQECVLPFVVAREDGHHHEPGKIKFELAGDEEQGFPRSTKATCGRTRSSSSPNGWA